MKTDINRLGMCTAISHDGKHVEGYYFKIPGVDLHYVTDGRIISNTPGDFTRRNARLNITEIRFRTICHYACDDDDTGKPVYVGDTVNIFKNGKLLYKNASIVDFVLSHVVFAPEPEHSHVIKISVSDESYKIVRTKKGV